MDKVNRDNKTGIALRPFVKWAGGKTQLLSAIRKFYPFSDKIFKYAEPFVFDEDKSLTYDFGSAKHSIAEYTDFMRKSGLFDLLQNQLASNLVDYATGVETGLDSNGRKNRGGHLMEDLVQHHIEEAGFVLDENYYKEMYIHEITEKWGVDLSAISNKGKTEKRFDFVIKTEDMIYVIETNFYGSGGSKLNETARSYKTLAQEIDGIDESLSFGLPMVKAGPALGTI